MHVGFIVARTDWPSLHAALEGRCGELRDAGPVSREQWYDTPRGEDVLHVTSVDEATYVLDPSMVLSADSDLVSHVARELSCLVVGTGAETVSGTFWLTAADGPDLRRLYFTVLATTTEPFVLGDPLPSEASVEWTDADGAGILARVRDLGLDTTVFDRGPDGDARRVAWVGVELPEPGSLSAQINQHCERHRRTDADAWPSNVTTVTTGTVEPTRSSTITNRRSGLLGRFKRRR